jgi:hypothetical protein
MKIDSTDLVKAARHSMRGLIRLLDVLSRAPGVDPKKMAFFRAEIADRIASGSHVRPSTETVELARDGR